MAIYANTVFMLMLIGVANAQNGALRASSAAIVAEIKRNQVRTELTGLLGHGDAVSNTRLSQLEKEMKSMYQALPKTEFGGLDHGVARYALHRYFVQQHGWHVKGLGATGAERWSDGQLTAMFEGRVPDYVLRLIEQRLGDGPLGLQELAILAATLEDLVHSEGMERVRLAFEIQQAPLDDEVSDDVEDLIVKTYTLFHVRPNPNYTSMSQARMNLLIEKAPKFLSSWLDTVMWVDDLRGKLQLELQPRQNPFDVDEEKFDFDSIVQLVEEIGEGYGQFQNLECRSMKNALLELDDRGNGRVRLSKFYTPVYGSSWTTEKSPPLHHFTESPEYLRHLGALDDSDPRNPSVILTNYLHAKSNCISNSNFYSICCIDECEALLAQLEQHVENPTVHPQVLVDVVARLSSDTVSSPRNLSAPLRRRLDDIADRHDGLVPIHGRLFAQWMHHAYPNECPYPAAPGTAVTQLRPKEWVQATQSAGRSPRATREDMQQFIHVDEAQPNHTGAPKKDLYLEALPWTDEEELVTPSLPGHAHNALGVGARLLMLMLALGSAGVGVIRMLRAPMASLPMHASKAKQSSWLFPQASKSHFV